MKRITLIATAVTIACVSLSASARKPHPINDYFNGLDGNVLCECDWLADPSTCTVTWPDVSAPTYGVSVEFEAEWMEGEVDMESSAEISLDDNWMCDGIDGSCSATGEFVLPEFPEDADIDFKGKVKGFNNGRDGATPRDFMKATGECNLPLI